MARKACPAGSVRQCGHELAGLMIGEERGQRRIGPDLGGEALQGAVRLQRLVVDAGEERAQPAGVAQPPQDEEERAQGQHRAGEVAAAQLDDDRAGRPSLRVPWRGALPRRAMAGRAIPARGPWPAPRPARDRRASGRGRSAPPAPGTSAAPAGDRRWGADRESRRSWLMTPSSAIHNWSSGGTAPPRGSIRVRALPMAGIQVVTSSG